MAHERLSVSGGRGTHTNGLRRKGAQSSYQRGGHKIESMLYMYAYICTWLVQLRRVAKARFAASTTVQYLVDVASDEEAVDDQAEAEPHGQDSSVPVAAR